MKVSPPPLPRSVTIFLFRSNFAAIAKQGRAPKTDGPRLRGASGVNVFHSFLALAPFTQMKTGATVAGHLFSGRRSRAGSRLASRNFACRIRRVARVGRAEAGRLADQAKRDGARALSRPAAPSSSSSRRVGSLEPPHARRKIGRVEARAGVTIAAKSRQCRSVRRRAGSREADD